VWSNGSNLTLTLGKSSHYCKVLWMLYGLGLWLVILSGLPWYYKLISSCLLIWHGMQVIRQPVPTGTIVTLSYQGNAWLCEQVNQIPWKVEQVIVLVNTGLFLLLKLTGIDEKQRILVVFGDQLSEAELRKLMWIQFIQS
jgi:hypothetical protein